ncbi:MAG: hypothetical protein L0211_07140 [Planctomycetaceae bacterium]|nr:hypothetical protein [Planctomycetaceae bacterium]
MTDRMNTDAGCVVIGDYVDEAESPENLATCRAEVVRPQVVANYDDLWGSDDGLREFTVLLKDGRTVAVRGHGLKHEPHPIAGQDVFSIVVRTATEEVLVALFKSADIAGIFYGDLCADRKIA